MGEFLKWVASSPIISGALVLFLGVVVLMYVVAFIQGPGDFVLASENRPQT